MSYLEELCKFAKRVPYADHKALKHVNFAVVLDNDGNYLYIEPLSYKDDNDKVVSPCIPVPDPVKRSGQSYEPNLLWDNAKYALGVDADEKAAAPCFQAFRERHEKLLSSVDDIHAKAFLTFLRNWHPSQLADDDRKLILGTTQKNIVFRLEDDETYLHDNAACLAPWLRQIDDQIIHGKKITCMLTGQEGTLHTDSYPFIYGASNAPSTGAALLSYNFPASCSYNKVSNDDTAVKRKYDLPLPITTESVTAYTKALDYLLNSDNNYVIHALDNTTMIVWADQPGKEEDCITGGLKHVEKRSVTTQADKTLYDALFGLQRGAATQQYIDIATQKSLDATVKFNILGLSINGGKRLAVRCWHQDTFGNLVEKFKKWYDDISLGDDYYPSFYALITKTVCVRKKKEESVKKKDYIIYDQYVSQFYDFVLTGAKIPYNIYNTIILRIRSDKIVDTYRIRMIKAFLIRNYNKGIDMALTMYNDTIAYRLGRLFALLEVTQRDALKISGDSQDAKPQDDKNTKPQEGKKGGSGNRSPLRERYISSASSTPAVVFPLLLRLAQHHVATVSRQYTGYPTYFSKLCSDFLQDMSVFPATLSLMEQGEFFLGYYRQIKEIYAKRSKDQQVDDQQVDDQQINEQEEGDD